MKNKYPSLSKNPLTWKCKLFGCRNIRLPCTMFDRKEKHGILGKNYVACTLILTIGFVGCFWCKNYNKIIEKEEENYPIWKYCDCDECENINK